MSVSSRHMQWSLFLFALVVYGAASIFFSTPGVVGDEPRYLDGAAGLLSGQFVAPEDPQIINGPGYPFLLAPMVALGFSLEAMRLANAVLVALAIWFTYRASVPYAGPRWAFGAAAVIAVHPVLLKSASYVYSEALATFCIASFGWAMTTLLRRHGLGQRAGILLPAVCVLALAWLVLTRVLFGYVLVAMTLLVGVWILVRRGMTRAWRTAFIILVLSFGACIPYLGYTYQLTGQMFKWSTNGGELLYWATSTHPGETGSWFSEIHAISRPELAPNHAAFFERIRPLAALEREAAFRTQALENIRANPVGVLKNWVANINRLAFGFPRSFEAQEVRTTPKVLIQLPILVLFALALFCMARWPRRVPPETWLLCGMAVIYLGLSTVPPATPRYFVVVLPWIGIVTAAVLGPRLRIRLDDVPWIGER